MSKYKFFSLFFMILILFGGCEKQDNSVTPPEENPPFGVRIQIYNFNNLQPISEANVVVELSEPDSTFIAKTDTMGNVNLPEIIPQQIQMTISHDYYYSEYNSKTFNLTYLDSVIDVPLTEFIEPQSFCYLPEGVQIADGLAWFDEKLIVPINLYNGMDSKTVIRFDPNQQNPEIDSLWGGPITADNNYPPELSALRIKSLMHNWSDGSLWYNYGGTEPIKLENSVLFRVHYPDVGWLYTVPYDYYLFHFFNYGYRYARDMAWYNDNYFFGCYEQYIFRSNTYSTTEHLIANESFHYPNLYSITGIECNTNGDLWGCNQTGDLFRILISNDRPAQIVEKYRIKGDYSYFSDMASDRNGNYWLLAFSNIVDTEIILHFNLGE